MFALSDLTQSDIDSINSKAVWTPDQQTVFTLLLTGRYIDTAIMQQAHIASNGKYYKIKKQVFKKIERVILE